MIGSWRTFLRTRLIVPARRPDWGPKVFCIGFNKTGTTSVGRALATLGLRHSSFDRHVWRNLYQPGRIEDVLAYTARFDSFDDLPWLCQDFIPVLDQRFAGSKFIYLEREEAAWKSSYVRWNQETFNRTVDPVQGWEDYCEHRSFVLDYFDGRPESEFITLRVSDSDTMERLGAFVGRDATGLSMPHTNSSGD